MRRSALLWSMALGLSALSLAAQNGTNTRLEFEADLREHLADQSRGLRGLSSAPPALSGGGLFIYNDFNVSVAASFPMSSASASSFAPYSGSFGWGINQDPGGTRGILGVGPDNSAFINLYRSSGSGGASLSANYGLQTFSGDLAEVFPAAIVAEPGSVMTIDPTRSGAVGLAREPYDRRVVGVVSGAKDYRPGVTLRGLADVQGVTLTLTGTVYCLASDVNGPIRAGDMLTSSSVPGYAMRAADLDRARGAILGKALEDMPAGRGHVLMLATLQ